MSTSSGPQPIQISEITAYISIIGGMERGLDFSLMTACIVAMDNVFFEHMADERHKIEMQQRAQQLSQNRKRR